MLAREHHFPATIAELYDPENMPGDLRAAHERNDEVLERIYIGRRFKNDTERLEKLFDLYTNLERRPPVPLTLRQVDPLIRQLTLYRDLIDRKTGDPV